MKPIKLIYICSIVGILAITSCKKDSVLNQTPPTALSDATFWTSTANLQTYVNTLYSTSVFNLYRSYGSLGIYSVDDNSDNMVPQSVDPRLNGLNTVASNNSFLTVEMFIPEG